MKTNVRDFTGSGMDLFIIITINNLIQNTLSISDCFNIFADTFTDDTVLKPTVWSFDFTFGLRG